MQIVFFTEFNVFTMLYFTAESIKNQMIAELCPWKKFELFLIWNWSADHKVKHMWKKKKNEARKVGNQTRIYSFENSNN